VNTPGEILRTEFLEPLGLSQNELAIKSGLHRMCINEIVPGQRRIKAESAIAFSKVFEIKPLFWLNPQRDYDLALEAKKSHAPVRSISRTILRRHIILTVPIGPNGSVDAIGLRGSTKCLDAPARLASASA